jgi:hypothetical protein
MAKLQYCPFTGEFFRLYSNGQLKRASNKLSHDGYVRFQYEGRMQQGHRVAYTLMGYPVPDEVDHINRLRDDNRWCNLRGLTSTGNKLNVLSKPRRSRNGKYEAYCGDVYLGTFEDELMAKGTMLMYKTQRIKEETICTR